MGVEFRVQEADEVGLISAAFVFFGKSTALGEVFDGGVGFDALVLGGRFGVIGCSVDFGDDD